MRRAMTHPTIALVGLAHRHVGVADGPAVAMAHDDVPRYIAGLRAIDGVREVALLATCNRTEVYLVADNVSSAIQRVGVMGRGRYTLSGAAAAEHLLRVACGLDSAILGDGQILGQVRQAYATARAAQSTGPLLNRLFETALRAGKRARHETGLGRGTTTTASAAVEMVARLVGPLDERHVLVVGAGETAKLAALHLARLRPSRLFVANRTRAHAEAIAAKVGATAIDLAQLPTALARADVVVSATSRRGAVISADLVQQVMAARPAHPLLAVDLAVPRDIEAPAGAVPGVTLLDLDCVQADAAKSQTARESSVPQVETIVAEEARAFEAWRRGTGAADVIRALRARVEAARVQALERSRRSDIDRDALDRQTRLLMNRSLHPTMLRLKALAGSPEGDARLSQWRAHLSR
jgi:glutamyl-tRNA reductase